MRSILTTIAIAIGELLGACRQSLKLVLPGCLPEGVENCARFPWQLSEPDSRWAVFRGVRLHYKTVFPPTVKTVAGRLNRFNKEEVHRYGDTQSCQGATDTYPDQLDTARNESSCFCPWRSQSGRPPPRAALPCGIINKEPGICAFVFPSTLDVLQERVGLETSLPSCSADTTVLSGNERSGVHHEADLCRKVRGTWKERFSNLRIRRKRRGHGRKTNTDAADANGSNLELPLSNKIYGTLSALHTKSRLSALLPNSRCAGQERCRDTAQVPEKNRLRSHPRQFSIPPTGSLQSKHGRLETKPFLTNDSVTGARLKCDHCRCPETGSRPFLTTSPPSPVEAPISTSVFSSVHRNRGRRGINSLQSSSQQLWTRLPEKPSLAGVILFHGFASGVFSWEKVMHPLAALTSLPILTFDRPGFGYSAKARLPDPSDESLKGKDDQSLTLAQNPYTSSFASRAAIGFHAHLGPGKVILVGHSAGGVVAIDTYLRDPSRIAAIVLVAPCIATGLAVTKPWNGKARSTSYWATRLNLLRGWSWFAQSRKPRSRDVSHKVESSGVGEQHSECEPALSVKSATPLQTSSSVLHTLGQQPPSREDSECAKGEPGSDKDEITAVSNVYSERQRAQVATAVQLFISKKVRSWHRGLWSGLKSASIALWKFQRHTAREAWLQAAAFMRSPYGERLVRFLVFALGEQFMRLAWHDPFSDTCEESIKGAYRLLRTRGWERSLANFISTCCVALARGTHGLVFAGNKLGNIACPVLVVSGDNDWLVPLRNSERVASAIPGARLSVIGQCGHVPQEERPTEFLEAVEAFLEELKLIAH